MISIYVKSFSLVMVQIHKASRLAKFVNCSRGVNFISIISY
jgi:hypothetical protein